MNYVEKFNLLGVEVRQRPTLTGSGAPGSDLEATIGELYMDKDTGEFYKCTEVVDGVCVWTLLVDKYQSSGGYGFTQDTENNVTFSAITDIHYLSSDTTRCNYLTNAISKLKLEPSAFLVALGDICRGWEADTKEQNKTYLSTVREAVSVLPYDYHFVIGNHDDGGGYPSGDYLFPITDAMDCLGMEKQYYSLIYRGFKFIFLSTRDLDFSASGITANYHGVSREQLSWLEKELQTDKKVIVFSHHPLKLNISAWSDETFFNIDETYEMLKNSGNVVAIISGHTHNYIYEYDTECSIHNFTLDALYDGDYCYTFSFNNECITVRNPYTSEELIYNLNGNFIGNGEDSYISNTSLGSYLDTELTPASIELTSAYTWGDTEENGYSDIGTYENLNDGQVKRIDMRYYHSNSVGDFKGVYLLNEVCAYSVNDASFHTIRIANGIQTVDGNTVGTAVVNPPIATNFLLFGKQSDLGTEIVLPYASGMTHKVKRFKAWDASGYLIADMVPAIKDNRVCMYCNIREQYYYGVGSYALQR